LANRENFTFDLLVDAV